LMLTCVGGAVRVAPADGVSCSGKEWAEAAAATPTIEATRARLIRTKARLLIRENLGRLSSCRCAELSNRRKYPEDPIPQHVCLGCWRCSARIGCPVPTRSDS